MNYLGVILAILSIVAFVFVRPDFENLLKNKTAPSNSEKIELDSNSNSKVQSDGIEENNYLKNRNYFHALNPSIKRVVGIFLAVASGILYGFMYIPTLYIMATREEASKIGSDYSFSVFSGILLSSIFFFSIYCIIKKNEPILYPKAILPSIVGGIIWGK